jgi:hypothetical protein
VEIAPFLCAFRKSRWHMLSFDAEESLSLPNSALFAELSRVSNIELGDGS